MVGINLQDPRVSQLLQQLLARQQQPEPRIQSPLELALKLGAQGLRQRNINQLREQEKAAGKTQGANESAALAKFLGGQDLDFQGRPIEGADQETTLAQLLGQLPEGSETKSLLTRASIEQGLTQGQQQPEFEGTGLRNQLLSTLASVRRGNLDEKDPKAQLAIQELSKPSTVVTPEGTRIIPALDVERFLGRKVEGVTKPEEVAKRPTERERTAGFASRNMLRLNDSARQIIFNNPGFNPGDLAEARGKIPIIGNVLASPGFRQYKAVADEFSRNMVFLRSGATARQEEVDGAFENLFTQPSDDVASSTTKEILRLQQMKEAYIFGDRANRIGSDEADEALASITRQEAEATERLALIRQLFAAGKSEDEVEALIRGE